MKYKQPRRSEDNEYIKLEAQLLKIVKNSVVKGKGSMSVQELVELVGSFQALDPFTLKMQILTLEGKGLIRKTQHGYILTEKAKKRL